MYGVETKALNQAVKRNAKRFEGDDFMFQLTKDECLRSQIVTLNEVRGKHLKYMPYAFTMLGVAMLSSVLRSETAIYANRKMMGRGDRTILLTSTKWSTLVLVLNDQLKWVMGGSWGQDC